MENNKRPENMERITTEKLAKAFIDEQVDRKSTRLNSSHM